MSVRAYKSPIIKNRSLFNETKKKKINAKRKSISLNNLTIITKNKIKIEKSVKKVLNIIEFIKQKNKFFIEDTFDVKGTREFLASKEVAMRVIKLNDEIEEKRINIKESSITNKNLLQYDAMSSPKNRKNKSSKTAGKGTISPRKSRKKEKRFNLEENNNEEKENKKLKKGSKRMKERISNNSSNIDSNSDSKKEKNNIIMDQEESDNNGEDEIYKFFIDNANEPDDNFQKKLKKEIKKFESFKNVKKVKGENKGRRKSQSKKDLNYKKPKRMNSVIIPKSKPTKSQFLFSEMNKKKMKEDDINVSSIDESVKACASPKKVNKTKVKKHFGSVQINNKELKERFYNKFDSKKDDNNIIENNENEEGRVETKSDKDSLISILSDLM
jgi:hypothetical protein